jgi:hypothetical protein
MMKKGVILFHKDILKIYENSWIEKSVNSMINQTDNDFTFYEVNYGGEPYSVVPNNINIKSHFWSEKLTNYAEAMNFILDKAFNDGCDYVFNTNLDDFYTPNRIANQIEMITKQDLDIVSSDFCYIQEKEISGVKEDVVTRFMNIEKTNIQNHLVNGHNVIAHPSVCYNKRFWLDSENRYDINKTPEEDLDLWVRSINRGYKFGVHDETLLYYRIHKNQVSTK